MFGSLDPANVLPVRGDHPPPHPEVRSRSASLEGRNHAKSKGSLPRNQGIVAVSLLEIRDVRKSFGGVKAVDGCSFAVEAGTITALIGPNGAGKTTMFNMINGLHRADSG